MALFIDAPADLCAVFRAADSVSHCGRGKRGCPASRRGRSARVANQTRKRKRNERAVVAAPRTASHASGTNKQPTRGQAVPPPRACRDADICGCRVSAGPVWACRAVCVEAVRAREPRTESASEQATHATIFVAVSGDHAAKRLLLRRVGGGGWDGTVRGVCGATHCRVDKRTVLRSAAAAAWWRQACRQTLFAGELGEPEGAVRAVVSTRDKRWRP